MTQPVRGIGLPLSAFLCASTLYSAPLHAADALRAAAPSAGKTSVVKTSAVKGDAPAAEGMVPADLAGAADADVVKARFKRTAPLKRLTFSAREGFSLKMVSNQDVTAEIRNGAGRTLARNAYTLEAGDWTLRPRNLAPGLYTVLLRTGPQLRSLRIKIEDSERGKGSPEWVLQKLADSTRTAEPTAQRGASVFPGPD